MATYYALTHMDSTLPWRIVAIGADRRAVKQEALIAIEQREGSLLTSSGGVNIWTQTAVRNLRIVSETVARRAYGVREEAVAAWIAGMVERDFD